MYKITFAEDIVGERIGASCVADLASWPDRADGQKADQDEEAGIRCVRRLELVDDARVFHPTIRSRNDTRAYTSRAPTAKRTHAGHYNIARDSDSSHSEQDQRPAKDIVR
jgi:hypothetical protein